MNWKAEKEWKEGGRKRLKAPSQEPATFPQIFYKHLWTESYFIEDRKPGSTFNLLPTSEFHSIS